MPVDLTVKTNPTRHYPQRGDTDNYGTDATLWAQDITAAVNATGYQYTWIMGSAAQVTSGEATHSNWTTLLADASNGDSIWVKKGTYTFAAIFDITKRLTIHNECVDCIYASTAGIAAGAILKFSATGIQFMGGTISQVAGTPDYAIEVNALDVEVSTLLSGVFAIQNILFTLGLATFSGIIRDAISASVYGTASAGANTSLSNLANPTTVNRDLTPVADNTYDLGTPAAKWADIQVNRIMGADTVGGTIGNVTPATIAKVDNIVINGDSIEDATNDLTLKASGVTKDVILDPTGEAKRTVGGGTEVNLTWGILIQARTLVKAPLNTLQQFAGADLSLAELQHFFGMNVIAYHRFGAGAALVTDEVGAYNLTLPGGGADPVNGTGFMGTAFAADFGGGQHFTQTTLLDDMTTTFSGVGKGLWHHFVVWLAVDGQDVLCYCFDKKNTAANDKYRVSITQGVLTVTTNGNSATSKTVSSSMLLPEGINTTLWFVDVLWNTTNGLSLYINRQMQDRDSTATTLMVDGTTSDLFIGADTTPANRINGGSIMHSAIMNMIPTEAQMDIFYATKIAEPAELLGKVYDVRAFREPGGDTNLIKQANVQEVGRYGGGLFLKGGVRASEDYYTVYGRV